MYRPSLGTALAAVVLTGLAPATLAAAGGSNGGAYEYRPYSQQNQAGSNAESSPANSRAAPATAPNDEGPRASDARGDSEPAYRHDARRGPPLGPAQDDDGDADDRADGPPPPPDRGPPQRGFAETRRVDATASAPDHSVPYSVREQDARRAAIDAWRSKAAERFGPEFSHWRMAERRRIDCVRERGDDAVCTVSGIPVSGHGRYEGFDQDDRN